MMVMFDVGADQGLPVYEASDAWQGVEPPPERPRVRGDCVEGPRPCPWVSCRHHLMLDIDARGLLQIGADDIDDMPETCSLDVADRGETYLEEIGKLLGGLTREGARQIELRAMVALRDRKGATLREFGDGSEIPDPQRQPRRLPILQRERKSMRAIDGDPKSSGNHTKPFTMTPIDAAPPARPPARETLADKAARLRKPFQDAASGPLIVAGDVMAIVENWSEYKEEAGGIEASSWVRQTFGRQVNIRWFQRRREAVRRIGEHARRTWHHDAAVWAAEHLDEGALRSLDGNVLRSTKSNGGVPLVKSAVQRLAGITQPRAKSLQAKNECASCQSLEARCVELESVLRANGIEVPTTVAGSEGGDERVHAREDAHAQHVE